MKIKEKVEKFISESREKILAAEDSIDHGFFKSATHDIYFAAENAARAFLLALEGNIPTNKNKIWMKINNYQRKNVISNFNRKEIDRTYSYRTKVNYVETSEDIVITEDRVISALDTSKNFVDQIERILKQRGFLGNNIQKSKSCSNENRDSKNRGV